MEMTDKEADDLDNYYTENTVMPDMSKPGYFASKYGMPITLDPETARTLAAYAETTNKTPAQIIGEMVHEKIAAIA